MSSESRNSVDSRPRRRTVGTAGVALLAVVAPAIAQQLPNFSGANCSMNNCDCSCVAGEQARAQAAVDGLRVDLPVALTSTAGRLSAEEALAHLWKLNAAVAHALILIQRAESDPVGAVTLSEIREELPRVAAQIGLPAPPAGWVWNERYLDSLHNSIRSEIERVIPRVERQIEIEKELNTCRQWADHKKCDPSLGLAGGTSTPTPPRTQPPPPPPVATPPRQMWPPDQPQPFARYPDGRPVIDDELLTRYIAAKRAQDAGESAPWRQGGFGQADFADVHRRVDTWARTHGTPTQAELFDRAELDAFLHREKEVRQAYTGQW